MSNQHTKNLIEFLYRLRLLITIIQRAGMPTLGVALNLIYWYIVPLQMSVGRFDYSFHGEEETRAVAYNELFICLINLGFQNKLNDEQSPLL